MLLTPHEQERLLLHVAAGLAQQRRDRGLKLNYPETVALISSWVLEGARDGRSCRRAHVRRAARAHPRRRDGGRAGDDLLGAGRGDVPGRHQARHRPPAGPVIPGEYVHPDEPVVIDRPRTSLVVVNSGDRPVQVGSHYHFAAANPALLFDRDAAQGKRLAVPAGTAVRFEPGVEKTVELVELGGTKTVPGLRLTDVGQP